MVGEPFWPPEPWSLPSREAWIEISEYWDVNRNPYSRFPRGKRGLKFLECIHISAVKVSLPSREAWIEIVRQEFFFRYCACRFPRGKRGLKSSGHRDKVMERGVASLAGSVD